MPSRLWRVHSPALPLLSRYTAEVLPTWRRRFSPQAVAEALPSLAWRRLSLVVFMRLFKNLDFLQLTNPPPVPHHLLSTLFFSTTLYKHTHLAFQASGHRASRTHPLECILHGWVGKWRVRCPTRPTPGHWFRVFAPKPGGWLYQPAPAGLGWGGVLSWLPLTGLIRSTAICR